MQEESVESKRPRRAEGSAPASATDGSGAWLPLLGLLAGLWAMVPPYLHVFGKLDVEQRVEFADHVIPGVAVLVISVVGYLLLRSPDPSQLLLFVGGAAITLAGFWMMATHFPLLDDARNDVYEWDVVLWHSVPGIVVTLLGVVWTIRFWGTEEDGGSGR